MSKKLKKYYNMNARPLIKAVNNDKFSDEELRELLEHEKKNKDRKTVVEVMENKLPEEVDELEEAIPIDWKIPVAFVAGVIITSIFFMLSGGSGATIPQSGSPTTGAVTSSPLVTLTILNDDDCALCDASWVSQRVGMDFPNLTVDYVDISSSRGQELKENLDINSVPVAFFDDSVEEASNFTSYSQNGWIVQDGEYWKINMQGTKLLDRQPTSKPTVSLFVMSQCPYGTIAQENMVPVMEAFGDSIDFEMHFIGNVFTEIEWNTMSSEQKQYYEMYNMCVEKENGKKYCSLHGEPELIGDIAELCAIEYYPDKALDYALSYINNEYDWEQAVSDTGLSMSVMSNCVNGSEGLELYEEDIKLAEELMIGSSPTFFYDNTTMSRASPEIAICTLHPDLSACSDISSINTNTEQPQGTC